MTFHDNLKKLSEVIGGRRLEEESKRKEEGNELSYMGGSRTCMSYSKRPTLMEY